MKIGMSHGAGGDFMGNFISEVIVDNFSKKSVSGGVGLDALDDGATIPLGDWEIVVSTDGHVVNPLFFPGGDIGRISVAGTVNDIAVMGAKPLAITNAMIIKEGFSIEDLDKIIKSMDEACMEVDVAVVAGDTKVMEQGTIDEIVVVTTGIGVVEKGKVIRDSGLNVGDRIIVTGSVGDHGISIMSFREGFGFETDLKSDVAPLWGMVEKALEVGGVTAMKDPTRGGLANAINEMANKSNVSLLLQDEAIPVKKQVNAVSEMLGIDPYEVANEGKIVMGVKRDLAEETLKVISNDKYGKDAAIIGEVIGSDARHVLIETAVGGQRILESPISDPVPRVC